MAAHWKSIVGRMRDAPFAVTKEAVVSILDSGLTFTF